ARRDPNKVYHRLDRSGLLTTAPHFEWNDYFASVGAPDVQAINVTAPDFFRALDALLARTRIEDVRVYLKWRAIEAAADALGQRFVDDRSRSRRGSRPHLRHHHRRGRGQGDGEGDDRQHREGVRGEPRRPFLDGRRREEGVALQAAQDPQQGRLSGEVARL